MVHDLYSQTEKNIVYITVVLEYLDRQVRANSVDQDQMPQNRFIGAIAFSLRCMLTQIDIDHGRNMFIVYFGRRCKTH